jgi:hypothetical protein
MDLLYLFSRGAARIKINFWQIAAFQTIPHTQFGSMTIATTLLPDFAINFVLLAIHKQEKNRIRGQTPSKSGKPERRKCVGQPLNGFL